MTRKKLTIRRKGYWRKSYDRKQYIRKDGTKVKGAHVKRSWVPASTFKREDIGAKGRGKKVIKGIKKGRLTKLGYNTSKPATTRHRALAKAVKRYGATKVWRMIHAQVIFRKRMPDSAKKVFEADRNWIRKTYSPDVAGPARRAWMRMSHKERAKRMPERKPKAVRYV